MFFPYRHLDLFSGQPIIHLFRSPKQLPPSLEHVGQFRVLLEEKYAERAPNRVQQSTYGGGGDRDAAHQKARSVWQRVLWKEAGHFLRLLLETGEVFAPELLLLRQCLWREWRWRDKDHIDEHILREMQLRFGRQPSSCTARNAVPTVIVHSEKCSSGRHRAQRGMQLPFGSEVGASPNSFVLNKR